MRDVINKLKSFVGAYITFATIDSHRRQVISDNVLREQAIKHEETIKATSEAISQLQKAEESLINYKISSAAKITEIVDKCALAEQDANNVQMALDSNNYSQLSTAINSSQHTLLELRQLTQKILDEINSRCSGSGIQYVSDWFDLYFKYLDSLTAIESGALSQIVVSIVVLWCL
jgi:hypothetical protein